MERSKESFDVQLSGCRTRNKIATISGGNDGEDPPVPIPNTEVKLSSAESTWLDTAREDKSLPDSYLPLIRESQGRFFAFRDEEISLRTIWAGGCGCLFLLHWSLEQVPEGLLAGGTEFTGYDR